MQGFYNGKTDEFVKDKKKKKHYKKRNNKKSWKYKDTRIKYPDAKKHKLVSFIKSGIRIFGYALLPFHLVASVIFLILSEIVGIIEETV
tara:strand:- start:68 stop:334 length:267 start_codon:yes stop_codon:yes gene_type:complete